MVLGQEKGEDLDSRLKRNFGMMRPEGYRKCIRLMKLANKFNIPVISFVDTPGAYPGIGAEQRGQAEAIASSIECCMSLKVPIISIIIGEGGSGGAIALASANKILMFEHAIYSVISPEGCASILWRDPSKSLEAAKAMKLTANELLKMKIIDEIIMEPTGGAHRNKEQVIFSAKEALVKCLEEFKEYTREEIFEQRKEKFLNIGKQKSFKVFSDQIDWIKKDNFFITVKEILFKFKKELIIVILLMLCSIFIFTLIFYKAPQQCLYFFPVAGHFSFLENFSFFLITNKHFGLFLCGIVLLDFSISISSCVTISRLLRKVIKSILILFSNSSNSLNASLLNSSKGSFWA